MYIDPVTCIDCAACEPVCPVDAIFVEAAVPVKWQGYIKKNADFFK
jgi:NAD-dependent dihydropyrimidine dehydrogenase PreA subunit